MNYPAFGTRDADYVFICEECDLNFEYQAQAIEHEDETDHEIFTDFY